MKSFRSSGGEILEIFVSGLSGSQPRTYWVMKLDHLNLSAALPAIVFSIKSTIHHHPHSYQFNTNPLHITLIHFEIRPAHPQIQQTKIMGGDWDDLGGDWWHTGTDLKNSDAEFSKATQSLFQTGLADPFVGDPLGAG